MSAPVFMCGDGGCDAWVPDPEAMSEARRTWRDFAERYRSEHGRWPTMQEQEDAWMEGHEAGERRTAMRASVRASRPTEGGER